MARVPYPRILLFAICSTLAYLFYAMGLFDAIHHYVNGYGYISIFLAGLLFSYGFTTPFAIAMFLEMGPDVNIFIAAPLAGIGALIADLFIMSVMRYSLFHEEIVQLRMSSVAKRIHELLHHESISQTTRMYLLWSFAGLIIASPLPDEFGVALVSGMADVDPKKFAALCFVLNTLGVAFFLSVGR